MVNKCVHLVVDNVNDQHVDGITIISRSDYIYKKWTR